MDFIRFLPSFVWFSSLVVLAGFLTLFLYFRAGRRELFGRELLFDFALVAFLGGLVCGRVLDFFIRSDFYNWSARKLFFFNVYSGFDVWGALAGSIVAGALFLKRRGFGKFWMLFDLWASPLAFGAALVSLGLFFLGHKVIYLALSFGYFIIFWVIKRLERIKRHAGFFISFFIVSIALLNLLLYPSKVDSRLLFGGIAYDLTLPAFFLILFAILWLFVSKRKIGEDLNAVMAFGLLGVFKLRAMLTSMNEANNFARSIIMLPLSISKLAYFLVLLVGREIYKSLLDFASALGVRR